MLKRQAGKEFLAQEVYMARFGVSSRAGLRDNVSRCQRTSCYRNFFTIISASKSAP
jgi:hypothetical protein